MSQHQPLTVRDLRRLLAMLGPADDAMPVHVEYDCQCATDVAVAAEVRGATDSVLFISTG